MKTSDMVRRIISEYADVTHLKEDDSLETIGLNSLDIVEISAKIEENFNIELMSEEIIGIRTMKDIVSLIEKKRK